jgi:hypothetical protein
MNSVQVGDTIISAANVPLIVEKVEPPYAFGGYAGYLGLGYHVHFPLDSLEPQGDGVWKVRKRVAA